METYFPCMPIPFTSAKTYIRLEGNVFASSKAAARRLAIAVNGGTPVGPEIHGNGKIGYFWHFHAYNRIGTGNQGGHIFYIA